MKAKFIESCLKQQNLTYNHGKIVNIYIVYEIIPYYSWNNYHTLGNCLFGASNLIKHADIDNYKFSGFDNGFDRRGSFSHASGGTGRNLIIFGVDRKE